MAQTVSELLRRDYATTQRELLGVIDDLSEEQFHRSVAPSVHSIAWHVWHASRWDDVLAAVFCQNSPMLAERAGTTEQLWHRQGLAAAWGLPAGKMGLRDAGTGLSDDVADALVLPSRPAVRAYAEGAFAFLESVLGAIDDDLYLQPAPGDPDGDTYGANVLIYAGHDDRHLGMIEAIRGVLGLRGTATT